MPNLMGVERHALQRGLDKGFKDGLLEAFMQGFKQGYVEGLKEGTLKAVRVALKLRFGAKGLKLLPKIRVIEDVRKLDAICKALEKAAPLEAIREKIAEKQVTSRG